MPPAQIRKEQFFRPTCRHLFYYGGLSTPWYYQVIFSSLPSSVKTHAAVSKEKLDKGPVYVGKRYPGQLENIFTSLLVNLAFFQK